MENVAKPSAVPRLTRAGVQPAPHRGPSMASTRRCAPSSSDGRIRVTVVGGLSRATQQWSRAGDAIGVELHHHDGRTRGHGSRDIIAAVRRADVVIIITDPNSHGGVAVARRAARSAARPHVLVKHLRPADLGKLIGAAIAAEPGGPA